MTRNHLEGKQPQSQKNLQKLLPTNVATETNFKNPYSVKNNPSVYLIQPNTWIRKMEFYLDFYVVLVVVYVV